MITVGIREMCTGSFQMADGSCLRLSRAAIHKGNSRNDVATGASLIEG